MMWTSKETVLDVNLIVIASIFRSYGGEGGGGGGEGDLLRAVVEEQSK